jgi:thiol-disulfide isomerase/thioredoxin
MEEFYKITEQNKLVIFYWITKWCPDCFVSKRFMPQLEKDFESMEFYSIDKNTNLDLAKHLNIYGVPSFLIYENNQEISRLVNKKRKTYNEVKEYIFESINK